MLQFKLGLSEYGFNILEVHYTNNETIEFDLYEFYKDQTFLHSLYDQINEYLTTLPDHTHKEIYDTIHTLTINNYKANFQDHSFVLKLEQKIAKVAGLLNYENFKIWIRQKESGMIIPDSVLSEYVFDPDMNTTKEKTYIRSEYVDLIGLIIFIRALSPLYLEYFGYIKQITPHYYYRLYNILVRTSIYTSKEIEKLRTYIEVNHQTLIGVDKNEHLVISAGLSDDDVMDSLISEVIFNKLITIDFFNKTCNIVSYIFQTIKYKGTFATSDSVAIRGKSSVNDPNKEDISYFEDYRKNTEVPLGIKVEIQHALSNPQMLLNGLNISSFDYERYNEEIKNINLFLTTRIDKLQIYILGWFLSKIINPRALFYIENKKVMELLIFAKVVLIQEGYPFIALLLSSNKTNEGNFVNIIIKNTIDKELLESLKQYYTHVTDEEGITVIEKTISEVSREIVNTVWKPIGNTNGLDSYINKEGYVVIPNNINDLVCQFVKFVVS